MNICYILWLLTGEIRMVHMLWKSQACIQRPGRWYSRKYTAVMTPYISTKTGILVSVFPFTLSPLSRFYAFVSLPPSFPLSPSQSSALMSQAHCTERSRSDVSVLLALNSRDASLRWQSLLFSCLLTSPVSTLTAFITLNIIILCKKRKEKTDEMGILYVKLEQHKGKKKVKMKWLGGRKKES